MIYQVPIKCSMVVSEKCTFTKPSPNQLIPREDKAVDAFTTNLDDDADDMEPILKGDQLSRYVQMGERQIPYHCLTAYVRILLIMGLASLGVIYYLLLCKEAPDTTAASAVPTECTTATNYSQSWRLEHKGENLQPGGSHSKNGYTCDFYQDSHWFRFSGAGGNRMMNSCVPMRSCGTLIPFWTNDIMPEAVGVRKQVEVYGAVDVRCKAVIVNMIAIRCSFTTPYDYIYKYDGEGQDSCLWAFCGMR